MFNFVIPLQSLLVGQLPVVVGITMMVLITEMVGCILSGEHISRFYPCCRLSAIHHIDMYTIPVFPHTASNTLRILYSYTCIFLVYFFYLSHSPHAHTHTQSYGLWYLCATVKGVCGNGVCLCLTVVYFL